VYSTMFEAADLMAFQAAKVAAFPPAARLAFQAANDRMAAYRASGPQESRRNQQARA
jgi:hypothetical protein